MKWKPVLRAQQNWHRIGSRAARQLRGEYVLHLPANGDPEPIVMWFQDLPEEVGFAEDAEFTLGGPTLTGRVEEFDNIPATFREAANSVSGPKGSMFWVRGKYYQANNVEINHGGSITIGLTNASKCPFFDHEVIEEYIQCLPQPDCD